MSNEDVFKSILVVFLVEAIGLIAYVLLRPNDKPLDTQTDAVFCLEQCHAIGCGAWINARYPNSNETGCICACEGPGDPE